MLSCCSQPPVSSCPRPTSTPSQPAAHSLVVAYDLTNTDPAAVAALRKRAPGQILFERATSFVGVVMTGRWKDGSLRVQPTGDPAEGVRRQPQP